MRITQIFIVLLTTLALASVSAGELEFETKTIAMPGQALRNQILFRHQDRVYAFGGTTKRNPRDFSAEAFADEGYCFDLKSGEATKLTPPPIPLMTANAITMSQGEITYGYVVGGISHDGKSMRLSDQILRYDFAADEWTSLECRLPSPRTLGGLVKQDGRLLFFGGWEMDFTRPAGGGPPLYMTSQIVSIDLANNEIEVIGELPRERRSFAIVKEGTRVFLYGGLDGGFDYVLQSECYQIPSGVWSKVRSPQRVRAMADAVNLDGVFVMAAGFVFGEVPDDGGVANPFDPDRSVEWYNPEADAWQLFSTPLPQIEGGSDTQLLAGDGHAISWSIDQSAGDKIYVTSIGRPE